MKIYYYILSLMMIAIPVVVSAKEGSPHLLSENKHAYPKKFRTVNDKYSEKVTRDGLVKLRASASGQFSENSLRFFLSKLSNKNVTVVDLRQEFHGYLNGYAICWRPYESNKHIPDHQIKEKEEALLKNLVTTNQLSSLMPGVKLESVVTERELTEKLGIKYLRLPITDHHYPNDSQIDFFVNFIKTLPKDSWLHFHCAGGAGRATTLMCMLDLMHNPHLTTEVIMRRQRALGGSNLNDSKKDHDKKRRVFLALFRTYCCENPSFIEAWSSWKKRH